MRCPRNATALISVHSRITGINEITYATTTGERKTVLHYAPYPKRVDMESGAALLERTWELLDDAMDKIKADPALTNSDTKYQKVRARAIAEVLAVLMDPFFTSADDIAKEAHRRWVSRQEGNTEYETPGLASEIWEPKPAAPVKTTPTKATVKNTKPLPDKAIPAVKLAIESGKFTVAQLAKMYDVSEETVKAAVAS